MPRVARPWFRFYVEAVHDRKLRRLAPEFRWLFVACLAAARASVDAGWLLLTEDEPMELDDIADLASLPVKQVDKGMKELAKVGIVEFSDDERCWFIPNWHERQFESDNVTERTRKHRSKHPRRNVPTSPEGTAPEKETENRDTDTDSSSSSGESKYACVDAIEDDDDPFWIQAKDIVRDLLRVNHPIRTVGPYVLTVVNDLKAKGWTPTLEPTPCFDPDCDEGWIPVGPNSGRACPNCKPYVATYLMEASN